MVMLIKILGNDYIVWDKASQIHFNKPGKTTIHAEFKLSKEMIADIKHKADTQDKHIFDIPIHLIDKNGVEVCEVIRTLYVRRKK